MTVLKNQNHWLYLNDEQRSELIKGGIVLCRTMEFTWYNVQSFYIKRNRVFPTGYEISSDRSSVLKDIQLQLEKGNVIYYNRDLIIQSENELE